MLLLFLASVAICVYRGFHARDQLSMFFSLNKRKRLNKSTVQFKTKNVEIFCLSFLSTEYFCMEYYLQNLGR